MAILLDETSPNGNVFAQVENDGRTVYFYLYHEESGKHVTRAAWVVNLLPAPEQPDVEGMRQGVAPLLPRAFCDHPQGMNAPEADRLRIVWFEEGDAAALLDEEGILAVVPNWGANAMTCGYSRRCIEFNEFSIPLAGALEVFQARVKAAEAFWNEQGTEQRWPLFRDAMLSTYESAFGVHEKYFAADGDEWPPRAIVRFTDSDRVILASIGMSQRPMPRVDSSTDEAQLFRRAEMAIALDLHEAKGASEPFARWISGQLQYPWKAFTWFGHGHTMPCDAAKAISSRAELSSVLFVTSGLGVPSIKLPNVREDPVNLLWAIPITDRERQIAVANESVALISRLAEAGVSYVAEPRRDVTTPKRLLGRLFRNN